MKTPHWELLSWSKDGQRNKGGWSEKGESHWSSHKKEEEEDDDEDDGEDNDEDDDGIKEQLRGRDKEPVPNSLSHVLNIMYSTIRMEETVHRTVQSVVS